MIEQAKHSDELFMQRYKLLIMEEVTYKNLFTDTFKIVEELEKNPQEILNPIVEDSSLAEIDIKERANIRNKELLKEQIAMAKGDSDQASTLAE